MTQPFVRPDARAFLDMLKTQPRPEMTAETLPAMRPMTAQGMAMLEPPIGELGVMRDMRIPGPAGEIPVRVFDVRATRAASPVVVFFHGGGFVIGDPEAWSSLCAEISRQLDLPVVSVDYRLAPEHPWPAGPDDAEAAARWVAENGQAFEREFTGLVLCGDSAGGTLTIVTALALRDRPAALPVLLQFPIYPLTLNGGDFASERAFSDGYGLDAKDMQFYARCYAPDAGHWRASPLLADQAGMPPTLVLTASLDPLRDHGRAYAAKTIAAGVPTTYQEAQGAIHGFAGFRRAIPSGQADLNAALDAARGMLAASIAVRERGF